MSGSIARHCVVLGAMVLGAASAVEWGCTAFDDLSVPDDAGHHDSGSGGASATSSTSGHTTTGPSSSGSGGGAGGPGGATQSGYLSLENAAILCGQAQDCPYLAATIFVSLGLPIGTPSADKYVDVSQSVCISWLSGPLPIGRTGVDVQQGILENMVKAPTCAAASKLAAIEIVAPNDPRCLAKTRCDALEHAAVNCSSTAGRIEHCDSPLYAKGTACQDTGGMPTCVTAACTAGGAKCNGDFGVFCDETSGFGVSLDCAYTGLACKSGVCQTSVGLQTCHIGETLTAACSTIQPNTLLACDGILEVDFACDDIGATCVVDPVLGGICKPVGGDCTPGDSSVDRCDGDVLDVCVSGSRKTVDCTQLGKKLGKQITCNGDHCSSL